MGGDLLQPQLPALYPRGCEDGAQQIVGHSRHASRRRPTQWRRPPPVSSKVLRALMICRISAKSSSPPSPDSATVTIAAPVARRETSDLRRIGKRLVVHDRQAAESRPSRPRRNVQLGVIRSEMPADRLRMLSPRHAWLPETDRKRLHRTALIDCIAPRPETNRCRPKEKRPAEHPRSFECRRHPATTLQVRHLPSPHP